VCKKFFIILFVMVGFYGLTEIISSVLLFKSSSNFGVKLALVILLTYVLLPAFAITLGVLLAVLQLSFLGGLLLAGINSAFCYVILYLVLNTQQVGKDVSFSWYMKYDGFILMLTVFAWVTIKTLSKLKGA